MGAKSAEEKQWPLFLSYASEDTPFANWLYKKLQSANLNVWYDKYQILVGDSITDLMSEGLSRSDFLIVVISQWAVKSSWVKAALEPKIAQQIKERKVTVLPLVLGNTKPEEISIFLQDKKWIRFPRKGSGKAFSDLLHNIKEHFKRKGLDVSHILSEPPTPKNPYSLLAYIDPEKFIVPDLPDSLFKRMTEDIVNKQSISIIGASMMGKSSLLTFFPSEQYQEYLDENGSIPKPKPRFARLNLSEHISKNHNELLPALARVMSEKLPMKKRFDGNTHQQALDWIKCVVGQRHSRRTPWILLFDDFDRAVELNGINTTLFDELYNLPQYYKLCYVFASHRKLTDLPLLSPSLGSSPFFNAPNFFNERSLALWNESVVQKLMFKPYGEELKVFDDKDVKFMVRLTARHPLLLLKGCDHLFNAYRASENKAIDYNKFLYEFIEDAKRVYSHYWDQEISDIERGWLKTLFRKRDDAQEELQELSSGQKDRNIRTKLARLGFVLSESGPLKNSTDLQLFLSQDDDMMSKVRIDLEIPIGLQLFLIETLSSVN